MHFPVCWWEGSLLEVIVFSSQQRSDSLSHVGLEEMYPPKLGNSEQRRCAVGVEGYSPKSQWGTQQILALGTWAGKPKSTQKSAQLKLSHHQSPGKIRFVRASPSHLYRLECGMIFLGGEGGTGQLPHHRSGGTPRSIDRGSGGSPEEISGGGGEVLRGRHLHHLRPRDHQAARKHKTATNGSPVRLEISGCRVHFLRRAFSIFSSSFLGRGARKATALALTPITLGSRV